MISLGGWTWSQHFSDAVLTAESRAVWVKSCIDLFIKDNLPDPVGVGWVALVLEPEYLIVLISIGSGRHPTEDTKNYTALLTKFRRQLDTIDSDLMLTIADPAAESKYSRIELNKIYRHDFINLLSYDLHGG